MSGYRVRASRLGLTQREVVSNVITALTSNQMIAPSYWVDQRTGNDYMLTVQYPEDRVASTMDLTAIPLRGPKATDAVRLDAVTSVRQISAPTEVNHYQLRRVVDIYVGLACAWICAVWFKACERPSAASHSDCCSRSCSST